MTTRCRGLRGAVTAQDNSKEAMVTATRDLLDRLASTNGVTADDVAAVWFTSTRDLNAEFPAVAARQMGWDHVALLCGHEMEVPDAMPRVIRVLMLVNTDRSPQELAHVYLGETERLRDRGMD